MAQPTGTFSSYDAVGNRESLADIIYNIAPTETPFMTSIGRGKADAVYEEWQTDSLAAADDTNAVIEGDDANPSAPAATVRVGNRCQISRKSVVITGTQEVVKKAGRKSEIAYQQAKRMKELKRDMEAIMSRNKASATGSDVAARTLGSLESWITTNVSRGAGGANGGFSGGNIAAPTDGTQRAFTETLLKTVIRSMWANGAEIDLALMGPTQKEVFSSFAGIATQYRENSGVKQATILAAASVYVSNYGELKALPSRFNRDRTVTLFDPEYWSVLYLRSFTVQKLAKTGDTERKQVIVEYTLKCHNEAANGVVADLT